jgi:hypothetical protein
MKPHVEFKLDYKKDALNYWEASHERMYGGKPWAVDPLIKEKIDKKSWKRSRAFLYSYLKEKYKKHSKKFEKLLKHTSEMWYLIEKDYFERLEKITKRPIYIKKFTAYLTTTGRCPYFKKDNSFMINIYSSSLLHCQIASHEIMHLQFHHYWEKSIRKKLGFKKFHDLKESLTTLLNEEFLDLIVLKDEGYKVHKRLREFISTQWKKYEDFDKVVDVSVKYLNKK